MKADIDSAAADAVNNPEIEGPGTSIVTRPSLAIGSPQQDLSDQLRPPILQIVHATGGLSKQFNPGDMVLDKTHLVIPKGKSTKMIVLAYTKYFKEYCSPELWNAGDRNMKVFATAEEAHAAGMSTENNNLTGEKAKAPMCMQWAGLLEKPADLVCEAFCIAANGKVYSPFLMYLERSAWWAVSKPFSMAAQFSCRERGIHTAVWDLKIGIYHAKASGNDSWVPNITLAQHLSDAEVEGLKAAIPR